MQSKLSPAVTSDHKVEIRGRSVRELPAARGAKRLREMDSVESPTLTNIVSGWVVLAG